MGGRSAIIAEASLGDGNPAGRDGGRESRLAIGKMSSSAVVPQR